jgi:hypothetical protein
MSLFVYVKEGLLFFLWRRHQSGKEHCHSIFYNPFSEREHDHGRLPSDDRDAGPRQQQRRGAASAVADGRRDASLSGNSVTDEKVKSEEAHTKDFRIFLK